MENAPMHTAASIIMDKIYKMTDYTSFCPLRISKRADDAIFVVYEYF